MENITFAFVLAIVVSALTSSSITSWWLRKRRQRPVNSDSSLPPTRNTMTSIKTETSIPDIVTHAADGILTFDKTNLRILMMNPAAEKLFGVQEAAMLGRPICTLVGTRLEDPGEDPTPAYRSLIERAVAANYPYDMMGYAQNRAMFPVEIAIVETQDGNEPLYLATVRDGSRRQLAEAARRDSEQKYRQLVRHMQDGVFILQDGRLPFVNQALADMLGYSVAELTGKHYTKLLAPEEHERVARYYDEALAEETAPVDVELCLQGRGETHRIIANMKTTLVNYNGRSAHMGTVINITARKQYETDLKLAKETAESASRSKSAFLANMSHELRTPLNAIIGYSEMLEEDAIDLEQTEFVPDLQKIRKAGRHLLELINGILDLSKIEAGKMDIYIEPFAIDELINDVVETIDPLIKKRGNQLILTGDRSGTMQADKTKVRQTLFNLLSNASKFTENGTITLETSCEDMGSEGEWIQFRVRDTGIGIAPEQLETLFVPFVQADATTTRKYGGTGLGLAISRRFCNMMGGDIVVESKVGAGSIFTVYLPMNVRQNKVLALDDLSDEELVEVETAVSANDSGTILVIDDDPIARDLIKRHLVREGFHVRLAENGQDGLALAMSLKPDAITLDVLLPSMDGWSVLSQLKSMPELADIPVIILTMVEERHMGFSLGAADYLLKPIDKEKLRHVLDKYRNGRPMDHHRSILVVEDDPPTRDIMCRTLEKEGWEVTAAQNGREALSCLEQQQPDLILLDLMMPELNGFQFITEMRQNEAWQSIPVIIVTAKELTAAERSALNGYVKGVFQKGAYDRSKLLYQISNLVKGYMRQKALPMSVK